MLKKLVNTIFFAVFFLNLTAQLNIPNPLNLKKYSYLDKNKKAVEYDLSKDEKKAFLFYDIKTEALAEVMYNGSEFVFDKTQISVFPIYFTGELKKKQGQNFPSKIPTQLHRDISKTIFKNFNISENDLPIFILYDEKNKLCGFAKNTEQINEIDCGETVITSHFLRLKILTEENDKTQKPYSNKTVFVIGANKLDTIAKVMTNKFGDFDAQLPNLNQDYLVRVNETDPNIKFALLSTQSGKLIGNFTAAEGGFVYRILKLDLIKLPDIAVEDDLELIFKTKSNEKNNQFEITENLFYESGKNKLTDNSKQTLNKIIVILKEHKEFNLLVISHTDSQGDSPKNLELSTQRSQAAVDYISKKGIDKSRLRAEGKGETEVRNRCKDNVDCSDKEHEYNRRTEFRFTKQ